jgi:TorA maturation chaperone TorD
VNTAFPEAPIAEAGQEALRSDLYALLASLLAQAPSAGRMRQLATLTVVSDIPARVAAPLEGLKAAAAAAEPEAVRREYADLFIGLGRGELVPYACWYCEKQLMGARLARLRADLGALQVQRRPGVHEPEDHAAALCETMVLMIARPGVSRKRQAHFFKDHLAPWMMHLFQDLQRAPSARFYGAVGILGESFMRLEKQALAAPAVQKDRPEPANRPKRKRAEEKDHATEPP